MRRDSSVLMDFTKTWHKCSSCEWALLKRVSRSEVKVGQGHSETACTSVADVDDVTSRLAGLFSKSICCLIATIAGASLNEASKGQEFSLKFLTT